MNIVDYADWQQQYDYMGAQGGGRLVFPGRSAPYTPPAAGVIVPANVETVVESGAVVDLSSMLSGSVLFDASGAAGLSYSLSADALRRTDTVSLASADLAALNVVKGDYCLLSSNALFDPDRTASTVGEMFQVRDVHLDGTITAMSDLDDNYLVDDGAHIAKVSLTRGVSFTGRGLLMGDNRTGSTHPIGIRIAHGLEAFVGGGLRFEKFATTALQIRSSLRFLVDGIFGDNFGPADTAYLISVGDASADGLVKNFIGNQVRHLATLSSSALFDGVTRRITFDGFSATNSARSLSGIGGDTLDAHAPCEDIHFRNGTIKGSSGHGFNFEGRSGSLSDVWTYDTRDNGVNVRNETGRVGDFVLSNVHTYRTRGTYGIVVNHAAGGYNRVKASDCSATDAAGVGFSVGSDGGVMRGVDVSGVQVIQARALSASILLQNADGFVVSGLSAYDPTNPAQHLLRLSGCKQGSVLGLTGRHAPGATGSAVYVAAGSEGVTLDGVTVTRPLTGSYTGLRGVLTHPTAIGTRIGANCNLAAANFPTG